MAPIASWMKIAATCGTIALPLPRMSATREGSLAARGGTPDSTRRHFPSFPHTPTLDDQGARSLPPYQSRLRLCGPDSSAFPTRRILPGPTDSPCHGPRLSFPQCIPLCAEGSNPSRMAWPTCESAPLSSDRGRRSGGSPPDKHPRWFVRPSLRRSTAEWAIQKSLCLICGEAEPAAHKSAPDETYPIVSRSVRTPASHLRPSLLATCSPNTVAGPARLMRRRNAGHRWRESALPICFPAMLKGWHGHDPVHTGLSSGQPARRKARDQPPMPAKK